MFLYSHYIQCVSCTYFVLLRLYNTSHNSDIFVIFSSFLCWYFLPCFAHLLHICALATPLCPTDVLYACRQKPYLTRKDLKKINSNWKQFSQKPWILFENQKKQLYIGNLFFNFCTTNHLQGEVGR